MERVANNDEWLVRAFELAYFIDPDPAIAGRIAVAAVASLDVAGAAQDKRLYYKPAGRPLSRKARTKVSLNDLHLLQRLVYVVSEPYEKYREQHDATLDEEDM